MNLSQNGYGKTHDKVVFAQGAVLRDDYTQIEVRDHLNLEKRALINKIRHFVADRAMYINISDSNPCDYGVRDSELVNSSSCQPRFLAFFHTGQFFHFASF